MEEKLIKIFKEIIFIIQKLKQYQIPLLDLFLFVVSLNELFKKITLIIENVINLVIITFIGNELIGLFLKIDLFLNLSITFVEDKTIKKITQEKFYII